MPSHETVRSEDIFSLRARRRFAAYIRIRLLEMREAGLERAADAVERGLPVDVLIAPALRGSAAATPAPPS